MFFRLVFISLLLSAVANAKDADRVKDNSAPLNDGIVPVGQWYLGASLGWGAITNPLRDGDDISLYLVPDFRYYGERLSIENLDLSFALYESPDYVLELVGQQNLDGLYFPGHNRSFVGALSALPPIGAQSPDGEIIIELPPLYPKHRSLSYMAGVGFRSYGWLDSQVSITRDVSNVHQGYEIDVSLMKNFYWQDFILGTEIGAIYKSSKLSRYYYNAEYEQIWFQDYNYQADAAINSYLKITANYQISDNFSLVANISNVWLDAEIHKSPIVIDNKVLTYFVGIKKLF